MAIDPSNPLMIVGAPGSPYSRKLRAVLRYRRIPHRWVVRGSHADFDTPKTPVALMPVLVFPDRDGAPAEAFIDSTPIIRRRIIRTTRRSRRATRGSTRSTLDCLRTT